MIFYNWKRIYAYTKSSNEIIKIIKYLTYKPSIYNRNSIFYNISQINWIGQSFLLNPRDLLLNANHYSSYEIANYIGLASLRNYMEYKLLGTLSLDLIYYSGNEAILNSRLLLVKDDRIYFRYESPKQGEKEWH